ncbi:MAG: hypothetical protein V2I36_05475 [Desulfopila sp.]|nr:hypothetical protein [Desulfopila sp.]
MLWGSIAQADNLVKNGSFESGAGEWTEWNSTQPWYSGATFEHDYAQGSNVWMPSPYPLSGNSTHSQRKGITNIHGGLYQLIEVVKGREYIVSGSWSGGIGGLVANSATAAAWFEIVVYDGVVTPAQIDAGLGGNDVLIAKREYSGNEVYFFDWETFRGTFKALSNHVTLAFKSGKIGDWDAIATYHDDVAIRLFFDWPMFFPIIVKRDLPLESAASPVSPDEK